MSRDPKLSLEEKARLMDPAVNELIPDGGPTIEPPELSPDYMEPPKRVMMQTGDLMDFLTKAAEGAGHSCERAQVDIGNGLTASSCPSGGLSIFKNGVQVYDRTDLSAEDQQAINEYRERNK